MLDINSVWQTIKEKVTCENCKKHWYVIAILGLIFFCIVF